MANSDSILSPKRWHRILIGRSELALEWIFGLWSGALFKLKCLFYGISCGKGASIFGRVILRTYPGCIKIGDRIQMISSSWREGAVSIFQPVRLRTFLQSARIVIEDDVQLHGTSITCRSKSIRIGSGTTIASNCVILDSDHHRPWPPENRHVYGLMPQTDADVTIGKNVWIGAHCFVLKGVTIGDNSVVAAGSIVIEDVPGNSLAAGNPAKVVKTYGKV